MAPSQGAVSGPFSGQAIKVGFSKDLPGRLMSADVGDEELERLKAARMAELQKKMAEEEERLRREAERQAAMRIILTPEARQRLANLRLIKPELVAQLEEQLIQLANSGRIQMPITDEALKEILGRLTAKRGIRIRRI